ncbi:MAG: PHP domain-containing protein [Nitrospinae bacterium]|nr:PHP domain-containing protein [Nitrospinota bacterium]
MKRIDLHTHTTASDGSYTPKELVRLASSLGLSAVAITDHDNIRGIEEGIKAGDKYGVEVVPGVEISVDFNIGTMHMLGYYIDYHNSTLLERLAFLQSQRDIRNTKIVKRLNDLGMEITYDEVKAVADGQVGRPHFAEILSKKGFVKDFDEAFDRFLGKGKPAYVEKGRFNPEDAIGLILNTGGIPVLAHPPYLYISNYNDLRKTISGLKSSGLMGVETYYSTYTQEQTENLIKISNELGLLITGGSDFHGKIKPDIVLGSGMNNNLNIEYTLLERIKRYLHER